MIHTYGEREEKREEAKTHQKKIRQRERAYVHPHSHLTAPQTRFSFRRGGAQLRPTSSSVLPPTNLAPAASRRPVPLYSLPTPTAVCRSPVAQRSAAAAAKEAILARRGGRRGVKGKDGCSCSEKCAYTHTHTCAATDPNQDTVKRNSKRSTTTNKMPQSTTKIHTQTNATSSREGRGEGERRVGAAALERGGRMGSGKEAQQQQPKLIDERTHTHEGGTLESSVRKVGGEEGGLKTPTPPPSPRGG